MKKLVVPELIGVGSETASVILPITVPYDWKELQILISFHSAQ